MNQKIKITEEQLEIICMAFHKWWRVADAKNDVKMMKAIAGTWMRLKSQIDQLLKDDTAATNENAALHKKLVYNKVRAESAMKQMDELCKDNAELKRLVGKQGWEMDLEIRQWKVRWSKLLPWFEERMHPKTSWLKPIHITDIRKILEFESSREKKVKP
jgi:hypothetical protein